MRERLDPTSLSIQVDRSRRHTRTIEVALKYQRGLPVNDICDAYEMSRSQALRIARFAGLPRRPKHFPSKIKDGVIAAYRAGTPLAEICALFAVSAAYASKTAKDAGVPQRKPQRPRGARHA